MNQDPALEVETASTSPRLKDSIKAQGPRLILGCWPAWLATGIVLTYLALQFLWLPPTPKVDYSGLIAETLICFIPLAGLFVIQSLRLTPGVYWPMMVGMSSLLLSHVTDALDEVRVQPVLVGILIEDGLAVLGYAFLVWGLVRWIGYNKQLLAALEESSQRLMAVLNAMEDKIYLADMETYEVLFLNEAARQAFGPVEGQRCYQVLQGLDALCPFCTNDQLLNADGSPAGVLAWEFQNQLNQRWYDLRDCAVRWTDGRLVRMEIATDITERKQMELRLRHSEERFRRAFDDANTGMCLVDLQGRLMQVNDRMSAIFGYSRQELEGMTVNDLTYPEDLTISPEFISKATQGLVDSITFDKRYRHCDGHLIYGEVASSLVRDHQGQPLYFISQVQDVTTRRLAEAQLRASEQRFRLVADHALDNIWVMGPDYRHRYLSPSIQSLVGYSVAEYLELSLDQMLMPDSLVVAMAYFGSLDEHRAAGRPLTDFPFRGEIELRTKDGTGIWTEIIVNPLVDDAGRLLEFAGVTRDIRERKRHDAQLQQARDAAEAANRALQSANGELQRLATTDRLTGIWNRAYFEEVAGKETALAARYGESLSLLLFDIDHFKAINDTQGHQVGDQVLIELTRRVGEHLRANDVLARWGARNS